MASKAEQRASSLLRTVLVPLPDDANIPDSEEFRAVLNASEFFVPQILAEIYPDWEYESLDGLLPLVARKTSDREAEIFGLCIIISDQTTTPIHLRLQLSSSSDEISWLECRLGEAGENGMVRDKWHDMRTTKRLHALDGRAGKIKWSYRATFGQKGP